jgi:hypothetical protein
MENNETSVNEEQESFFDKNLFKEEFTQLDEELKSIDNLYDEVKTHFDKIKNSNSRGSLTFIEKQTSNLVSLRSARLNVIKEKINIKRTSTDFKYKEKQLAKSNGENVDSISDAIYSRIAKDFLYNNNENTMQYSSNGNNSKSESDIDKELEELLDEEDLNEIDEIVNDSAEIITDSKSSDNNDSIDDGVEDVAVDDTNDDKTNNTDDTTIIVDTKGENFYVINSEYDIIEELGHVEKIDNYFEDEEDGTTYAVGLSGSIYLVLEVE